ncbi:MAG: hypothetical protein KAS84_01325 [Anaerolineales bacterium]|nr:hypothetical protein [Anaerolineales bacterium]
MYQLVLLLPTSVNLEEFDETWPSFLKVAEQMPGLIKESVSRVDQLIYGSEFISRIYTFTFPDQEALEKALVSTPGERAGRLIHDLTDGKVILLTARYQEDFLNHIQSFTSPENDL